MGVALPTKTVTTLEKLHKRTATPKEITFEAAPKGSTFWSLFVSSMNQDYTTVCGVMADGDVIFLDVLTKLLHTV